MLDVLKLNNFEGGREKKTGNKHAACEISFKSIAIERMRKEFIRELFNIVRSTNMKRLKKKKKKKKKKIKKKKKKKKNVKCSLKRDFKKS